MRGGVSAATAGGLLVAVSMLWLCPPAHAHALLIASSPADGATVERAPAQALLTFTEAPDPVLSEVRVLDASGKRVEASRAEPVPEDPRQLRVSLGTPAAGTYTLSWRVTSRVDGHTTLGSVAFGVGVPAVVAGPDPGTGTLRAPKPTIASVVGRWLFYAGAVLMLGAAVVGLAVVARSPALLGSAWAAAAAGVALTAIDQRTSTGTSFAQLLSSPTGHKLTTQAVAVALGGVAVLWACLRWSRSSLALVGVGASAAMLARVLAGHANASSARWLAVGAQWVHLVSVGAWLGGLVWFLVVLRRGELGQGSVLGRRFSSVAGWMVALVAVSGSVRALDEIGGWDGLFDTGFGAALRVKLALFVVLVAVGALNRFRHLPLASGGRPRRLRRAVGAEVAVAAGVLAAAAVLAGLPPSASLAAASRAPAAGLVVTGHDYATSMRVRLVASPGSPGPNRFELTAEDYDSRRPVPAESVSLRFRPKDRPDVAAPTLELARGADSRWHGSGNVLSVEGRWGVTALVETATDAVEVPMELTTRAGGHPGAPAGATGSCGEAAPDASYGVTVASDPDPPTAEGTRFRLTVRRDGRVVSGAKVCVTADMPEMQHPGTRTVATEASPGTYEAQLRFSMTGAWAGAVTVVPPDARAVVVPVRFEVR